MATHSSTLAWNIPWTEEAGRLQSMGSAKSQTGLSDFTFAFFLIVHLCLCNLHFCFIFKLWFACKEFFKSHVSTL